MKEVMAATTARIRGRSGSRRKNYTVWMNPSARSRNCSAMVAGSGSRWDKRTKSSCQFDSTFRTPATSGPIAKGDRAWSSTNFVDGRKVRLKASNHHRLPLPELCNETSDDDGGGVIRMVDEDQVA